MSFSFIGSSEFKFISYEILTVTSPLHFVYLSQEVSEEVKIKLHVVLC